MKYIVPLFDGFLYDGTIKEFCCGCKYIIKSYNNACLIFDKQLNFQSLLDLTKPNENLLCVPINADMYCFLFRSPKGCGDIADISFKGKHFLVSLIKGIKITESGNVVCDLDVDNVEYSQYEEMGNMMLVYFKGIRNYIIVLKDSVVEFCGYIDEFNIKEDERYFLERQYDSINHGRVCHISKGSCEKYLVYLDDNALNIKEEFVATVFLDCVKVKNFGYARQLTNIDFDEDAAFSFFPEFDFFYPITSKKVVLINKNALAGIFEFDIKDCKIDNIIQIN